MIETEIDRRYVKGTGEREREVRAGRGSDCLQRLSRPAATCCCWRVARACRVRLRRPVALGFVLQRDRREPECARRWACVACRRKVAEGERAAVELPARARARAAAAAPARDWRCPRRARAITRARPRCRLERPVRFWHLHP